MTNSIGDLSQAEVFFIIGSNTTEAHPIVALEIKKALRNGAKLIVADPRETWLAKRAEIWLRLKPGSNVALLNAMASVILKEGLEDSGFIAERTEGFEEFKAGLEGFSLEWASAEAGVPADLIEKAARLYAGAERAAIIYAMGVTQHERGTDNVLALANLAMLTGNVGKPGSGVNPLRGQNNVQGACDVGCLPDFLPGYAKVADGDARERFHKAWSAEVPPSPGLTAVEMTRAALEGKLKVMFIMGENPVVSDPDSSHVKKALESLDFLVVSDLFLTDTAALADVVFPAASFAEKDGTFTNTERRVQRVRSAIAPPGEAKADSEMIALLAKEMGFNVESNPERIFGELATVIPQYSGISYEKLESGGVQWPCSDRDHPGTPILHVGAFSRGKGKFHAVRALPLSQAPDDEFPLMLTTGRVLHQYHTISMSGRTELNELEPGVFLEINPTDAAALDLGDGDPARVASRRGEVVARVRTTERVPRGTVFMPFHYPESPANILTGGALDPRSKIPPLKTTAVRVEKA